MERIREEFLDKVERHVSLAGLGVLEIGCGTGSRSTAISQRCKTLTAIEPDRAALETAVRNSKEANVTFQSGSAQQLAFPDDTFDMSIFTLSLHHVPVERMGQAIGEAVRVTRTGGHVIFLEPTFSGSFFTAELQFDACDGDERAAKARAYYEILNYPHYTEIAEIDDETVFKIDSVEDFDQHLSPKRNVADVEEFLHQHNFTLTAARRINIFRV